MNYSCCKEMPVWLDSMNIAIAIFEVNIVLPKSEGYRLTSRIRRFTFSILVNLSEGFGSITNADKAKFYIIARGSAFKTINHLIFGNKVGYFESEKVENLKIDLVKNIYALNKLISYLRSKSKPQCP